MSSDTSDAPIVVIKVDEKGDFEYLVNGNVMLLFVDENCPNDRVYECTSRAERSEIISLIGTHIPGFDGDGAPADDIGLRPPLPKSEDDQ